jgi:hypothetical protein
MRPLWLFFLKPPCQCTIYYILSVSGLLFWHSCCVARHVSSLLFCFGWVLVKLDSTSFVTRMAIYSSAAAMLEKNLPSFDCACHIGPTYHDNSPKSMVCIIQHILLYYKGILPKSLHKNTIIVVVIVGTTVSNPIMWQLEKVNVPPKLFFLTLFWEFVMFF